jgi:hypothetical protein
VPPSPLLSRHVRRRRRSQPAAGQDRGELSTYTRGRERSGRYEAHERTEWDSRPRPASQPRPRCSDSPSRRRVTAIVHCHCSRLRLQLLLPDFLPDCEIQADHPLFRRSAQPPPPRAQPAAPQTQRPNEHTITTLTQLLLTSSDSLWHADFTVRLSGSWRRRSALWRLGTATPPTGPPEPSCQSAQHSNFTMPERTVLQLLMLNRFAKLTLAVA